MTDIEIILVFFASLTGVIMITSILAGMED